MNIKIKNRISNVLKKITIKLHTFIYARELFSLKNKKIHGPCYIVKGELLNISGFLSINHNVYINASGGIDFGNNVILSSGSQIISTGLKLDSNGFEHEHINKKISIGNNVQVGAGAIVLAGVDICDNVVIGAGAVVSKNINSPGVYTGVPARKIRDFQ